MLRSLTGVAARVNLAITQIGDQLTSSDGPEPECRHEADNIHADKDESIWHLQDSYLRGEPYWTAHDAAFLKTRERVKEFRCFGCGEERTITTGEIVSVHWKDDMTAEEIAEMHEETDSGSWFNGRLWWEDNIWDGEATEVASEMQWYIDIGYTDWKDDSRPEHDKRSVTTDANNQRRGDNE